MKNIVALIPARSGSKGIPNKNIKNICGNPLIAYSIRVAQKSKLIDRIIVSTDSQKYADIAKFYGAEVPFLRPTKISDDTATDTQFINHAIEWFEENELFLPEFFIHLRPTTPLRDPYVIDNAIKSFINSEFSALRSCHKMSESSYKTFEVENSKLKTLCDGNFNIEKANHNRQSYPETFDANGYIDIIRTSLVKNHNLIHGNQVKAYITEKTYEVDEKSDIDFLEYSLQRKPEFIKSLFG